MLCGRRKPHHSNNLVTGDQICIGKDDTLLLAEYKYYDDKFLQQHTATFTKISTFCKNQTEVDDQMKLNQKSLKLGPTTELN